MIPHVDPHQMFNIKPSRSLAATESARLSPSLPGYNSDTKQCMKKEDHPTWVKGPFVLRQGQSDMVGL